MHPPCETQRAPSAYLLRAQQTQHVLPVDRHTQARTRISAPSKDPRDMSSLTTAGPSISISSKLPFQLIGSIAIPFAVVAVLAMALCGLRSFLRKRREAAKAARGTSPVPVVTQTAPSTATMHDDVEAGRFANERVNGHECTTGLTVPIPAKLCMSRVTVVGMPMTPYIYGQQGQSVSLLDLGKASTASRVQVHGESGLVRPDTPCLRASHATDIPHLELGLPAQVVA